MKTLPVIMAALIIIAFWIIPVVLASIQLIQKNRSIHWIWFGINPLGAWIVLFVAYSARLLPVCEKCKKRVTAADGHCKTCGSILDKGTGLGLASKISIKTAMTTSVAISLVATVAVLTLFGVWKTSSLIEYNGLSKKTLDIIINNPVVRDCVGDDIKRDMVAVAFGHSNLVIIEDGKVILPIRGSKASANILVFGEKVNSEWKIKNIKLIKEDKTEILIFKE